MAAALTRAEVVRKGRSGCNKMHSESSSYIQHSGGEGEMGIKATLRILITQC